MRGYNRALQLRNRRLVEMKLVGVIILVQMIGGTAEPRIDTKVLDVLPLKECERQVAQINESMAPPKFNDKGETVIYQRQQCALMTESELKEAVKVVETAPE